MPYLTKEADKPESVDCRILTAALELFVDEGYHNVSVHDVQKLANVSIGSIYNHFGGKEGIAKALYYHLLNEIDEMVDSVIEEDASAQEHCNRIIQLLFEYTETRPKIIAFVFHPKHKEFLPDEPPICSAMPFQKIREVVQKGMNQGDIRESDLWVASAAIFGGAIRMIQLRLEGMIEKPLPEYFDALIDTAWSGMSTAKKRTTRRKNAKISAVS